MKFLKYLTLSLLFLTLSCEPQKKTFKVVFMNEDVILQIDENVEEGTIPEYKGETPTKINPIIVIKDYTFIGWDKEITPVTSDVIYNAVFKEGETAQLAITFNSNEEHQFFTFENPDTKVDWGDDNEPNTENSHIFIEQKDYIIRFYCDSLANFQLCEGLDGVKELYFADSVKKINNVGFKNCDNLEKMRLPNNLNDLNAYMFSNNTNNFYKVIDNVYYLGNEENDHLYCFGTANLEEIKIAEGCEVLTKNLFEKSTLTKKITLPESLKLICDNALTKFT